MICPCFPTFLPLIITVLLSASVNLDFSDSTHKTNCASFSVSPFSLSVTSSRFGYIVANVRSFFFFKAK